MTILHKHHKQLLARGAHVRAGMLYKIATAQIYDGSRVCEHNPDALVACALCGSPDDSMFHRVYDCPCTPTSFELDKTDQIVDEARMRAFSCPIFWFRGLPPSSWYPELPFAEQPFAEDFGSLDIAGGHVFTDGSGGTETKDPRLRRCGYGVAWVLANGGTLNTRGGRAGILHGKVQSVARAELLAAVVALELCVNATQQVTIWTDCMFVVNGFARGRRRRHLSHADLWLKFWKAHDGINPPVLVHKVWRSHVTTAEITAGIISPLEAYGNEAADKLAARGALRNALSMEYVASTRNTDSRVRLVQTRLIEINLLHVQNRTKTVQIKAKAPERRAKFDPVEAMNQLNRIGHGFSRMQVGKGRFTYKCRFCFLRGERSFLKQLLGKPCSTISRSVAPLPVPVSIPTSDEPESFFIGDTPSSEDDPFGWCGNLDQNHQDVSDQDTKSSPTRPMNHDEMNLDILPKHVMEEVKSRDEIMEEDKPDEDPFGWGGDLSQDHQDMLDQSLPSNPDRSNGSADAYLNLLPDREMEDPKTSEYATRTPDVLRDAVDTTVVALETDAQTDLTLVPVSTSTERMAQNISRRKSRSPRRHVREESFGLTSVHLSHQFGFRDSTLWCWRCGGWSVGSRRTSRLKGPCGAPTKNGADVVYRVSGGLPPRASFWRSDDVSRIPERIPMIENPYSNRFRPQVLSQADSHA